MNQLISKIQYRQFETGEFIGEKPRTYEEIIEVIEQFSWEAQREHIIIDLTNPSITIHGKNHDYLKLALFFNGRFVLHYLDAQDTLFSKSFANIADAYPYIKNLFEANVFELRDFRKENTMFQHNLKHFLSQDFRYVITPARIRRFLLSTSGINLAFGLILIVGGLIALSSARHPGIPVLLIIFLVFFAGGGINLLFFFNYYHYTKDKILIMSKGNDVFFYGQKDAPLKYEKSFIMRLVHVAVKSRKNSLYSFAVMRIELKDGTEITIPNLLVNELDLKNKLAGIPYVEKSALPWVWA